MKSAFVIGFKAFIEQARANKLEYCKKYVEKHSKPIKKEK